MRNAASPAEAATAYAELAQIISTRIDPLLRLLLGVRDTDRALGEFARITDQERRAGATFYVQHWASTGWLRQDITLEHAIDAVWALNSPQTRWLLLDHGWTGEEYARWLGELIRSSIFAEQTT